MALPKLGRRRKKFKKGKAVKPLGIRTLIRDTFIEFKLHWKAYVLILLVVTLPSDIITLVFQLGSDPVASTYLSFAAVIMNASLIWAMVQNIKTGRMPGVIDSYYEGSTVLVRYIVITFVIVIMLIPAALGGALYATALQTVVSAGSPGPEVWFIALGSLIIATPSFVLLVRFSLATYGVIADGLRPKEALRWSRRYTLGRFWKTTGRFAILGLVLMVVSIPILIVTFLLAVVHLTSISTTFFEIATTLVALPVANIYLYRMYRNLQDTYTDLNVPAGSRADAEVQAEISPINVLGPDNSFETDEPDGPDDTDDSEAAENPA
jgi:hypothetical protein